MRACVRVNERVNERDGEGKGIWFLQSPSSFNAGNLFGTQVVQNPKVRKLLQTSICL